MLKQVEIEHRTLPFMRSTGKNIDYYILPSDRFFNTVVSHENNNAGTSAISVPWMEHEHAHSQQTGRQTNSSSRVYTQHVGH